MEHAPDHHLTYRLDRLTEEAIKAANQEYRRRCGLTVREVRILRLVRSQPGITFSQLVEETFFERSFTSRTLNALIKRGLIERAIGKTDARQFELTLTKQGRALAAEADLVGGELEELFLTPLNLKEREALIAFLDRLTDWVRQGKSIPARK